MRIALALFTLTWAAAAGSWAAEPVDLPPWQKPYTGSEAAGPGVIAFWSFEPPSELKDASGHGHDLTLRGESRVVAGGRFGSCLESFPADENKDKPQGALAKNDPRLTPAGAFTLELWFKPKPEMDDYTTVFLVDKKNYHYAKDLPQANSDYCLLMRRTGPNRRRITAWLGFGKDSAMYDSTDVQLEPDRWYHVAFTYDGAGTAEFFLDGKSVGQSTEHGRGPIVAGRYPLVIGCRNGSIHHGFPAYIDQVRICDGAIPFFSGELEIDASGARTAFLRMEDNASVPVVISNNTGKRLIAGTVRIETGDGSCEVRLRELQPAASQTIDVPVDTALRPGSYAVRLKASARSETGQFEVEKEVAVTIVTRPLPNEMPVVLWGTGDPDTVRQIGFTHQLVHLADYSRIWDAGTPVEAVSAGRRGESAAMLDEYLVRGLGAVVIASPGRWLMGNEKLREKYQRVDRSDQPYERENPCVSFPEIQAFGYNTGAAVAKTFGCFPALEAALIHSEVRDSTNLCFHDHDRRAFRDDSGFEIPDKAVGTDGVSYERLEGFPENRVVSDDDPLLVFYRWFWKNGDGWNSLHTRVHEGLKSTGRVDLWTFFDPAVRVPSVWGSGGEVDVVSQWTYSYPDPLKIGQATDELFAMAGGNPDQQVMKMTQIIWYRSQTAPKLPDDPSKRARWEEAIPDARFITISPDHLREAFWSKISRPVRGIMYHGWGSLVPSERGSYQFTHPETREVLSQLIRDVVRPLGPTLLAVPDRKSDVAILESFASQVFARRGTRGWGKSWEADMHLILQWAQIQPRILYDETILRDGLDGIRVLVMPHCDILTAGVAARIAEFQKSGGIVIGDEHLCPAIKPDIPVPSYRRTGKADEDKAALQAKAAELREVLDGRYQRRADSSSPDVVVRLRQYGDADYLFAINDKRTFGEYVGHHGRVMEKGLPASASLTLRRPGGHVYDLVCHRPVPSRQADAEIAFDVELGPGEGRVLLVTDQEIAGVRIKTPSQAKLGERVELGVSVVDSEAKPIAAVVPLEIEILDAEGRPAEFTGFYAAKDGRVALSVDPAKNDKPGTWTIRARELASGKTAQQEVSVLP